ncbi:uroporphyrinogen-III synthase [Planococcus salinus]|uniref:Uroporphyrinogen-III synthase n=1 Tax=Planococcus salinus TaxID=1848460 RepID=A0A3M8PB41_9BACL|nr:uroporphyrinogen-III synthase [Planococcus salinus]RNF40917.1 uroporphyrinogen-III synthase [Planococcus salinus]
MYEHDAPLNDRTIVFTGSNKPQEAVKLVGRLGGKAIYLPLIETSLCDSEQPDFKAYDWLIFTSRNSAEAFGQLAENVSARIAAVGDKTAETLKQYGYEIDFKPTVFSADRFVEEFPAVAGNARCLFVRGSLAKDTITSMPLEVDEWTVYETLLKLDNAKKLIAMKNCIVIFASPSAVAAYCQAGGNWEGIRVAAIGHVTEHAIVRNGGHVDWIPERYTYLDVINEIAKGS